jgi:predicted nuclease of predicted toxin-antitoxin system
MPDPSLNILLDQNIPLAVADWLQKQKPAWDIRHVNELGFEGLPDEFLYKWAQQNQAVIITYDEDFADARLYPLGRHHGVIRLRVWPTTIEKTNAALERLLQQTPDLEWSNHLIIIDNNKIRVRKI